MHRQKRPLKKNDTSWEKSSKWYAKIVGKQGHYYHTHVVLPNLVRLLQLKKNDSLLDIGCGQGIVSRAIGVDVTYYGVDASASLIHKAQKQSTNKLSHFVVSDATKKLPIQKKDFSHATAVFSLQNMEDAAGAIRTVAAHIKKGGTFIMVLNHPCFRVPKNSGWGKSADAREQYRWVARYMSPLRTSMQMHPGKDLHTPKDKQEITWSFHHSLSEYSNFLYQAGFAIEKIEEWVSDKKSSNTAENLSFAEIPLFMAIVARKM